MNWAEWRVKRGRDTREIVKVESTAVEKLPQSYLDELARIRNELKRFQDSQEYVVPKAFQEVVERIERLETMPDSQLTSELDSVKKALRGFAALMDMVKNDVEAANRRAEANRAAIRALMEQMDVIAGKAA
jgi:archaellum component FlaC